MVLSRVLFVGLVFIILIWCGLLNSLSVWVRCVVRFRCSGVIGCDGLKLYCVKLLF